MNIKGAWKTLVGKEETEVQVEKLVKPELPENLVDKTTDQMSANERKQYQAYLEADNLYKQQELDELAAENKKLKRKKIVRRCAIGAGVVGTGFGIKKVWDWWHSDDSESDETKDDQEITELQETEEASEE